MRPSLHVPLLRLYWKGSGNPEICMYTEAMPVEPYLYPWKPLQTLFSKHSDDCKQLHRHHLHDLSRLSHPHYPQPQARFCTSHPCVTLHTRQPIRYSEPRGKVGASQKVWCLLILALAC